MVFISILKITVRNLVASTVLQIKFIAAYFACVYLHTSVQFSKKLSFPEWSLKYRLRVTAQIREK